MSDEQLLEMQQSEVLSPFAMSTSYGLSQYPLDLYLDWLNTYTQKNNACYTSHCIDAYFGGRGVSDTISIYATVMAMPAPKAESQRISTKSTEGTTGARKGSSVLGRVSTADLAKGTTLPRNLRESLAVQEAMGNTTVGTPAAGPMGDPRWPASEDWVKLQQLLGGGKNPVNVHYLYNPTTGAIDDFKIVIPGPRPR